MNRTKKALIDLIIAQNYQEMIDDGYYEGEIRAELEDWNNSDLMDVVENGFNGGENYGVYIKKIK